MGGYLIFTSKFQCKDGCRKVGEGGGAVERGVSTAVVSLAWLLRAHR